MSVHPFATLSPDLVLDAVESAGFISDARVLALNSYENRVYQVGIEGELPIIAKFYRPERWTDAQIIEEHELSFELEEEEIPLIAPMKINDESLFKHDNFRFALFERRGGQATEPGDLEQLYSIRQRLGPMKALGSNKTLMHRT